MKHASKDPAPDSHLASWKMWAATSTLFATGLLLGLALFFPRDVFWDWLLTATDHRITEVDISWQGMSHASWRRARLNRIHIVYQSQTFVFSDPELVLGMNPWLRAKVHSGSNMVFEFQSGKRVSIQGEMDLSQVKGDLNLKGNVSTKIQMTFEDWGQVPVKGTLQLHSTSPIKVHPDMILDGLNMQVTCGQQSCQIKSLQAERPVQFSCTGQARLKWPNILHSTYQVRGVVQSGNQAVPFERQGRLRDLWP
ncbi:MAG: hypothetical protein U5L00_21360 [Desulfovermiculus sp.]|nr:hypothetical protein [Desulfovermiculus sp.]